MMVPFRIGLRYSHARRGSRFIGLNTILSVLGITIGIASLIVVLSVMNGVMTQVRNGVLSFTSHVSIRPYADYLIDKQFNPDEVLRDMPEIQAAAPYTQGQALIGSGERFQGILLQGVDAQRHGSVSSTFESLSAATKEALLQPDSFNIVLGHELVTQMNLNIGDKVTVMVPQLNTTGGGVFPRMKRFTLIDVFRSGNYQFDLGYAFSNSESVSKLMQLGDGYSGWQIMLNDPMDAPRVREALRQNWGSTFYFSDWSIDNANYFNAVQLEKNAMFIILSLIIIVALFSLLSTMYMVVTEKRRDIAILRTMGMNRRDVALIFTTQGMIFGLLGIVMGVILGIFISLNIPFLLDKIEQWSGIRIDKTMYMVENLSAQIEAVVIYQVVALTLLFTLLFSIVPALIAARTQPARALSQE